MSSLERSIKRNVIKNRTGVNNKGLKTQWYNYRLRNNLKLYGEKIAYKLTHLESLVGKNSFTKIKIQKERLING